MFEKEVQFDLSDISLENVDSDNSLISLCSGDSQQKIIAKIEEDNVKFQSVPKESTVLFTIYDQMNLLFLLSHKTEVIFLYFFFFIISIY